MVTLKQYILVFLFYTTLFNYLNFLVKGVGLIKERNRKKHSFNILSNINNLENKENYVNDNSDIKEYFHDYKKENGENNNLPYYVKNKNNRDEDIMYSIDMKDESKDNYKRRYIINRNERKILTSSKKDYITEKHIHPSNIYLQSFNIKKKQKYVPLNKTDVESSNIELRNKLNYSLNPALTLVASRAVDGLLGGVHQHMQGPIALNTDGNNSPLSTPIVTPNLYPSPNMPPNMPHGMPPPPPPPPSNAPSGAPGPVGSPPPPNIPPVAPGGPPPPNSMTMASMNAPNPMTANTISQNPAFNIHPTASNLRGDPGNVTSNEIVSITIGIVLSLFLFCFISGCLIKMCKPKKRRR